MNLFLHQPDWLEDAEGNRHLVAGLVEVDKQGKLLVPEPPTPEGDAPPVAPPTPTPAAG